MFKAVVLISMLSFSVFVQANSCGGTAVENNNDQLTSQRNANENQDSLPDEDIISISELNKRNPAKGNFTTKGFVAKVYTCPPCPPDAQCKPCMRNNIVISDEKMSVENYDIGPTKLIIFTNDEKKYAVGEQYEFKIRITENKTTASESNDIELVSSKLIN